MTETLARPRLKITYATLRNDNDELHAQFEKGVEAARAATSEAIIGRRASTSR